MAPRFERDRVGRRKWLLVTAFALGTLLAVQVAAAQPAAPAANPAGPAPARPTPAAPAPAETRVDLTSAASPAEPPPDDAAVDLTGAAPLGPPPLRPAEEEEEPALPGTEGQDAQYADDDGGYIRLRVADYFQSPITF